MNTFFIFWIVDLTLGHVPFVTMITKMVIISIPTQ
jgi:hypothetical protein